MKRSLNIDKLVRKFDVDTNSEMNEVVLAKLLMAQAEHLKSQKLLKHSDTSREHFLERSPRLGWICGLVAVFIAIIAGLSCYILAGKVADLKDELEVAQRYVTATPADENATINLYLTEHQEIIAQHASLSPATHQPAHIYVNQNDILYYEIFENQTEISRPGIIVRGPLSQRQINSSDTPSISNGHTLTLSEAQENANFDLVAPPRLHPFYMLDQIRRIEGCDSLQLLYTDSINSVSLFEQPLNGQRGLEPYDFREYAVYCNQGQAGGTILAWRDDNLSYVLIGNIEISQLMNWALLISARK